MFERLENIKKRYDVITNELSDPKVISDIAKTTKLSKEQSDLSEIIECYDEYLKAKQDFKDAKELENDAEMKEFAQLEEEKASKEIERLESELQILLLPRILMMVKT